MRDRNFNTGLRGVLFEAKHYARMGPALWLYGWLVLRQTRQVGSTGLVLGGTPITYREIKDETGFTRGTLERWMSTLRRAGYIETETVRGGMTVRITKAKKFTAAGVTVPGNVAMARRIAPRACAVAQGNTVAQGSAGARAPAPADLGSGHPGIAGASPESCGERRAQLTENERLAGAIGSNTSSNTRNGLAPSRDTSQSRLFSGESAYPRPSFPSKPETQTIPAGQARPERHGNPGSTAARSSLDGAQAATANRGGSWRYGNASNAQRREISASESRRYWRDELVRRELAVGRGPEAVRRRTDGEAAAGEPAARPEEMKGMLRAACKMPRTPPEELPATVAQDWQRREELREQARRMRDAGKMSNVSGEVPQTCEEK